MSDVFRDGLTGGSTRLGLKLEPAALDRLALYCRELQKWAAKMNLVARGTSVEQLLELHFVDSLTLLPLLAGSASHLLDIGSGAGFPGLVCAAAQPELAVTLVEPRQKRANFLRHMARILGLAKVEVVACRIEDEEALPSSRRFTHITGRAVAELAELLEMSARFAAGGGRLMWMKGPRWQEEYAAAEAVLCRSPHQLVEVMAHRLPFSGAERNILIFELITTIQPK